MSPRLSRSSALGLVIPLLLCLGLVLSGLSRPLDTVAYDLLLASGWHDPDPQVLIVAIDEQSLYELGRWPWPRALHAELLDRLTEAGVQAILLNVVFAEPDGQRPQDDQRLAQAIARHGKTVLPLLFESLGGQLLETLPIPALATAAAALGHVDVSLDRDGHTRGVYRLVGVGVPFWSHASLALLELLGEAPEFGLANPTKGQFLPHRLVQEDRLLIPLTGPVGSYPQVSVSDVLAGRVSARQLQGRIAFVGVTVGGLGDGLFIPQSSVNRPMSGVEFTANVFDALRHQRWLRPLQPVWQALLSGLLVLACAASCRWGEPRRVPLTCGLLAPLTVGLSLGLGQVGLWFSPAPAVLVTLLTGGFWYFRRLGRLSETDSLTGLGNRRRFDRFLEQEWRASRRRRTALSLLLIDVDFFKPYNDGYGHPAGDRCLQRIGGVLAGFARRPRDLSARYGGEEFALILGDTEETEALRNAERLRRAIYALALPHGYSRVADRVTVSIGTATLIASPAHSIDDLLRLADEALYEAKHQGRNRVWQASLESSMPGLASNHSDGCQQES